jgi:hypothetical protein
MGRFSLRWEGNAGRFRRRRGIRTEGGFQLQILADIALQRERSLVPKSAAAFGRNGDRGRYARQLQLAPASPGPA